jgi:hypothetical protein
VDDGLDRAEMIELLERLGAEDDAEALAAARTIHARIVASGVPWDVLLVPEDGGPPRDAYDDEEDEEEDADEEEDEDEDEDEEEPAAEDDPVDEAEDDEAEDDGRARDETEAAVEETAVEEPAVEEPAVEEPGDEAAAESDEVEAGEPEPAVAAGAVGNRDLQLIERLLKRPGLTESTREDLELMKEDIAEGSLSAMDRNYLKALEKRLKG